MRKRFRAFKRLMAGIPSDHELLARGMCINNEFDAATSGGSLRSAQNEYIQRQSPDY